MEFNFVKLNTIKYYYYSEHYYTLYSFSTKPTKFAAGTRVSKFFGEI